MKTKAQVNAWLKLYQQERRHLVQVCQVSLNADVEERHTRIAEHTADVVVGVIEGVLGLAGDPRVGPAVRRHLMAVDD